MHRIVFTPSFVAAAREIGWTAAAERFRAQCLEIAPRPGASSSREDDGPRRRAVDGDLPAHPAPPGARAPVRRAAQHAPRASARTSRAPGRTSRATTSTRSTGTPPRGSRSRAGAEEFVVREHYAEEAPRVVVLCDRRPSMSIFPEGWPWLVEARGDPRTPSTLIGASAIAARGLLGYFDEADGEAYWHPPRSSHALGAADLERPFGAPEDTLARGLRYLAEHGATSRPGRSSSSSPTSSRSRRGTSGSTRSSGAGRSSRWSSRTRLGAELPGRGRRRRPVRRARSGSACRLAALTEREARERREANETRSASLLLGLRALDLDPVLVSSHEPRDVVLSFLRLGRPAALHAGARMRLALARRAVLVARSSPAAAGERRRSRCSPAGRLRRGPRIADAERAPLRRARVVARIDVDRRPRAGRSRPTSRVKTDFEPYEPLGRHALTRDDIGRFTHLRYRHAALPRRALHPAHRRRRRRSADARAAAVSRAQQRAEKRSTSSRRDRHRRRPEPKGRTLGTRRLAAAQVALAHQLGRRERRRAGLPVRRDRHAAAGAHVPGLADGARASVLLALALALLALPVGLVVRDAARDARAERRARSRADAARARARARRVGERAAVRRRAARGARGARVRARRARTRAARRRARELRAWSPPSPEPERDGRARRRRSREDRCDLRPDRAGARSRRASRAGCAVPAGGRRPARGPRGRARRCCSRSRARRAPVRRPARAARRRRARAG